MILKILTFSIMTFSMRDLFVTLAKMMLVIMTAILSIMTFIIRTLSILTLRIKDLVVTLIIDDTQHKGFPRNIQHIQYSA